MTSGRSAPPAITASTALAGVIGDPVAHSLSPALHNAAFAQAGVDAVYVALRVAPAHLATAVAGLRAVAALGASVTVPHKRAAAALCDRLTSEAERIGAVNCLAFERHAHGTSTVGHNTDAGGFVDSLVHDARMDPVGCRAVLLGAGGAARAVHAGLTGAGASHIDVVARAPARVDWVEARPWTADSLDALCPRCDLVVDCTSAALDARDEAEIPAPMPVAALPQGAVVASLIYHREPALLAAARARGLRVLDGAGMLVYQAARAFEIWTDVEAPVPAMWAAMRAALRRSP